MDKAKESSIALVGLGKGVFGGIRGRNGGNYGGAQQWFAEKWQRNTCCGTVAAANIFAHMANADSEYRPLYAQSGMDTQAFLAHQKQVLEYVKPLCFRLPFYTVSFGILSTGMLKKSALAFAASRGVQLNAHSRQKWLNSRASVVDMLSTALGDNKPVAMLVHFNRRLRKHPSGSSFARHWVTVTGMRRRADGALELLVSSWNREYTIDFDVAWRRSTYIGFVYFE